MMVGKSSRSRPVSTSLGWQITTWTPSLTCRAYHASLLRSIHARAQHCRAEPFVTQDSLKPGCNVVLLRVHGKDLTPPSFRQFVLNLLDQSPFFGIDVVLGKVARFCNNESHSALEFGIELSTVQRSDPVWVIGIQQQGVQHRAQDRTVTPVGFQRLPHVIRVRGTPPAWVHPSARSDRSLRTMEVLRRRPRETQW